jgi:hypothetical protein
LIPNRRERYFSLVLWRGSGGQLPIVWGVIILIAGSTANALAWITLCAEDVPELVAAAPIAGGEIVRVKLAAALLPIVPLVLLPLLVLRRSHWWFGFSVTVCAAGSAATSAALNVRNRTPGRRRDFRTRYKARPGIRRTFRRRGMEGSLRFDGLAEPVAVKSEGHRGTGASNAIRSISVLPPALWWETSGIAMRRGRVRHGQRSPQAESFAPGS